jgi:hypothetical protein
MSPLDPLNVPAGALSLDAATVIADAIDSVETPPAGNPGDMQFNGTGVFANADAIAAGALAELDGSGDMTFLSPGVMSFLGNGSSLRFIANDTFDVGGTTISLNAGGDTFIEVDSGVTPETITLDSDLGNTKIFIGKSNGLVISIGGTGAQIGFFHATPVSKPTVTGSKGGNVALTSLIAAFVALGLITDTTT